MRLDILIGGKAGQGINTISKILSRVLTHNGYFVFNYRDYPSVIRGCHNFNVISISDSPIFSHQNNFDGLVSVDEKTLEIHKTLLKKNAFVLQASNFESSGSNVNFALAGALIRKLGLVFDDSLFDGLDEIKTRESFEALKSGYKNEVHSFTLKPLKRFLRVMDGGEAVSQGAVNSGIDLYLAYPMTPSTNVLHELASKQFENKFMVLQPESEIAVANIALGASFAGAKTMIGTSGGGFDLMTEALSFQGISEIPLVVYLASRVGPGTGAPTYTLQGDLDVALRAGHGEFPRVVIAPGDPTECVEKTNEAFYLSQRFNSLSIILSDRHLAESEFSSEIKPRKPFKIEVKRSIPGEKIVRALSYEHNPSFVTDESAEAAKKGAEKRLKKYSEIKSECEKLEMFKIHGKKDSKNLIIGWGSTKGAILDAIKNEDFKFLQVLYLKPLSNEIKKEMEKAKKIILIENNVTGQLGRLIREKTGIKIQNKILKYDGRPFTSDEIKKEINKFFKK